MQKRKKIRQSLFYIKESCNFVASYNNEISIDILANGSRDRGPFSIR